MHTNTSASGRPANTAVWLKALPFPRYGKARSKSKLTQTDRHTWPQSIGNVRARDHLTLEAVTGDRVY